MNNELAFYVHIPYCARRCGYCDFNTYTPSELSISSDLSGVSRDYIDLVIAEIASARKVSKADAVPTIFFGGGTPTLMEPKDLGRVVTAIKNNFDLAPNAEITTEANPDTVTKAKLAELREAGINRISFGMQSAVPHVLSTLDRTHNPANVVQGVRDARAAGFDELSVDLIYGTPGESMSDWQESIDTALSLPISHISAYALIVEQGTKLGAQVKRGEVVMPDDDETADKYLLADEKFKSAGLDWYELSNWSKPGSESKHNLAYWNGANWWGAGPGAHSHIDGKRWWNVKHPTAYKERISSGQSPLHDQEELTHDQKSSERIMLEIRLARGIDSKSLTAEQLLILEGFKNQGHLLEDTWASGRIVLSTSGRLIADRIVREILS
jgi:oxygen-independent coproporphyrinogen-3 oxidase